MVYLFVKVGQFLFRIFYLGATTQQREQHQAARQQQRKAKESNLNIDYVPGKNEGKNQKGFTGGDYVDYEEVD
ncbi:MAG: hypothetical protein OEY56_01610 [Cyclobacteriaceae bacterium]|nr:hypothetical protein [Cyclobacteriaceae bacterium]